MFQLEILDLIKKYNLESNEDSKKKILLELGDVSLKNELKIKTMKDSGTLDLNSINLIEKSIKEIEKEKIKQETQDGDIGKIRNAYLLWIENFRENNNQINQTCIQIVEEIVSFYGINRFDIIEKILSIKDSLEFEYFKNHIKNTLRVYFSKILVDYSKTENFLELSFFKRYKKEKEIYKILKEIDKYKFNIEKIKKIIS